MRTKLTVACSLFLLGALLLLPLSVHAEDLIVGVNLVNQPDKLPPDQQEAMLNAMRDAGVRVIRAGIIDDDKNLAFVERVYARGMKIEWIASVRGQSGNMILSTVDPDKFRAYYEPLFTKLEGKGGVFAGIELGNEINSVGWNHDLGPTGTGRMFGMDDLLHDPKGQRIAKGYLQYIKVLAVLKDIRDHSKLNRNTPIITAGLASWLTPAGQMGTTGTSDDAVRVDATLQFLHANGADQYVDAYGLHSYPPGNATPAARLSGLQQLMAECRPAGSGGKPCWMTEWGLPVSSGRSCPVVDDKRTAIFTELREDFRQFARQGRLAGLFFYSWQGGLQDNDPYGAVLCGALTKSGRLAIAPM